MEDKKAVGKDLHLPGKIHFLGDGNMQVMSVERKIK